MPAFDVCGERKAMAVMQDTWGHLAPKQRKVYAGTILVASGCFAGDYCVVESEFEGLDASPWFYENVHGYICNQEWLQTPGLYRFVGTYRYVKPRSKRYLDEGYGEFAGTWEPVAIPPRGRR